MTIIAISLHNIPEGIAVYLTCLKVSQFVSNYNYSSTLLPLLLLHHYYYYHHYHYTTTP